MPTLRHRTRSARGLGVALLLAASATTTAALAGLGTLSAGRSVHAWQESVRVESDSSAGVLKDEIGVYAYDAPAAVRADQARLRGAALADAARHETDGARRALRADALIEQALQSVYDAGEVLASDPAYRREGAPDPALRLAAVRRARALPPSQPLSLQQHGDRLERTRALVDAGMIPAALAFLAGALAQAFGSRRSQLLVLGALLLLTAVGVAVAAEVWP